METSQKIDKINITQKMKGAYLEYAMSVIIGRALPDVRDGLKPVHRRILFTMDSLNLEHTRPYAKSARVVGDVIGKYHPHGDSAVYDSLVRLAQDFSLRYPLVDGQGNFGSVDGDEAAAMRYTEVRLRKISKNMLLDLEKNTVDFQPNYDSSLEEPVVMPSAIPNLLMNGSTGIAVGMATNIPPHNLAELIDALLYIIDNQQKVDFTELMSLVPGPDFPTAGQIMGRKGIIDAYKTGHGIIYLRGRANVEKVGNRMAVVISELPYNVNKARLVEKIAQLVNDKILTGIHDIRDETARQGMRVVIELKKDEHPELIINKLYANTSLQVSYGINMLAIVNKEPKLMSLETMLRYFLKHREEIITRRTRFELIKAEEKLHIALGLSIALANINPVIELIKSSNDTASAKAALIEHYELSDVQSQAILEMRLQKLTSLEQTKLSKEISELQTAITGYREILASTDRIYQIIRKELEQIRKDFTDPRLTEIVDDAAQINQEELIKDELFVVTLSQEGYIKRTPASVYQQQKRGGKGKMGMSIREEDLVDRLLIASALDSIMFFSNAGKIYWKKVYELPEASRISKGRAIVNIFPLTASEHIVAWMPIKDREEKTWEECALLMLTAFGTVKKTPLSQYRTKRVAGTRAIALDDQDSLVKVQLVQPDKYVFIATKLGMSTLFHESEVRPQGRVTRGVRGIRLKEKNGVRDICVALEIVSLEDSVLTVGELGYGKISQIKDYRLSKRGNMGVLNMRISAKTGAIKSSLRCNQEQEIIIITENGYVVRLATKQISMLGRVTQGVRLVNLSKKDRISSVGLFPQLPGDEDKLTKQP